MKERLEKQGKKIFKVRQLDLLSYAIKLPESPKTRSSDHYWKLKEQKEEIFTHYDFTKDSEVSFPLFSNEILFWKAENVSTNF